MQSALSKLLYAVPCVYRGKVGDLYVVLHVDEKQGIERNGLNLYSKINVYYTEAILGTTIKVLFPCLFNFLVVFKWN